MDVDVHVAIEIDRPVEVVRAYAADPNNAPEWYENIESIVWLTPPPVVVGSRMTFVARFLGRRLEYTYVVAAFDDRHLVMSTAQGPFPMETTYTWDPAAPGSTRMTLRNRGRPAGFSRLMAPLMRPAMRRANGKDLTRLKELLERS